MFNHVGLHVRDLIASRKFYAAVFEALGHVQDSSGTGFGPEGAPALWLYEHRQATGGAHLALVAPSRAVVDRFHRAGLGAGGRDNGAPGLRVDYGPTYYAAFLLDPDGNNVEAVCLQEVK